MSNKRYTDTNYWQEDWFLDLTGQQQLFWKYINDNCSNVGVWKPNIKRFTMATGFVINLDEFLALVGKRIVVLENSKLFLPSFIRFQFFDRKREFELIMSNPLHRSLIELLKFNEIETSMVNGLVGIVESKKKETEPEQPKPEKKETEIPVSKLKETFDQRRKEFKLSLKPFTKYDKNPQGIYDYKMIEAFFIHWSEANKSRTKMRWERETTWELKLRLAKWDNNNFGNKKPQPEAPKPTIKIDHRNRV